jgi:hypothetical protein
MKSSIILNITLCIVLGALVSCSDFLDVNVDPNNPTEVDPALVLPSAQMHICGILNGDYAIVGGIWSQHWTQSHVASQYRQEDRYALRNSDYNGSWRDLYSDALIDLSVIRDQAEAEENWATYLQATSLMAFTFQMLADFYGEIPFSEALKGDDGIEAPKFDQGETVYDGLITMLDEALGKDLFSTNSVGPSTDFVFGDLSSAAQTNAWIQFANTLKLKIYLRQTKARPDVAQQGIQSLLTTNAPFLTTAAEINVFSDVPNQSYPLYETDRRQLNVTSNLRASNTLISFLVENEDPRISTYFIPGSGGQMGLRQGDFNALSTDIPPAAPSVANILPTSSFYFFSADEVAFMLAEAHARYGEPAMAKSNYNQAVQLAFTKMGLDGSDLIESTYAYPQGTLSENLEAIIIQKWVAMVERGYESFFDQNRTDIPAISSVGSDDPAYVPGKWTYSVTGTTGGLFPKRLIFPDITRRNNPNTPAEIPITEPVWWAK